MPKKNNQSRRRKNAGKHVEDRKEADDVASESSDEEVVQPPPPPSPPQREVVDSDDSEYSDEESEDFDSDADTALKQVEHEPFVDPPMSAEEKLLFFLGGLGFVVFLVVGMLLPSFGLDQSHVMAGGMGALLLGALFVTFCPWRRMCKRCCSEGEVPWQLAFLGAACLGVMIGGMFGGVVKYYLSNYRPLPSL